MSVLLGVTAAAIVAGLLVYFFPEGTEKWLSRLLTARRIVFGIGAVILGLFLLATSAGFLPYIGFGILVSIFVYVYMDPDNELQDLNPR